MEKTQRTRLILIVSGALTAVICLVMNLWLIPEIEKTTEGLRCFDMNSFGYTHEQAQRFLSLLGERGRELYLHVQLPLDFVYPTAYTAFFVTAIALLRKKKTPLWLLPAALAAFDVVENTCSIIMLKNMSVSPALAGFASTVTVIKSILMTAVFVLLGVLFVLWLTGRKKEKAA